MSNEPKHPNLNMIEHRHVFADAAMDPRTNLTVQKSLQDIPVLITYCRALKGHVLDLKELAGISLWPELLVVAIFLRLIFF